MCGYNFSENSLNTCGVAAAGSHAEDSPSGGASRERARRMKGKARRRTALFRKGFLLEYQTALEIR